MNKLSKIFWVALLLLVMPMRQYAQTVNNNRIEIEIAEISNPDLRYCVMSALAKDDNLIYSVDEDNNSVIVTSANEWSDSQLQTYYDSMRATIDNEFSAYERADKETQGETFIAWKESLPQDLFVLLFRQMLIENPNNRDGNQTCATADPFCTTDAVSFYIDASVTGSCEPGPDYGCMSPYTSRPPYWFYMKIGVAGTFTIRITNTNNNDLDFCAWGPFTDPVTPCTSQLTSDKIIDCDSPYNSVQECTIPANSQVGQYYLMVITRYSSGSTTVNFSKIQNGDPGETDCGILPPLVDNDGPYCVGQTIHLTANGQAGATYSWSGPNGWTSNQQNPTRPNCTMAMAGTYTCTITIGGQSNSATTEVVVYPQPTANFTFTTVCQGQATQFTSTSTTNPSGQQITSYLWNFGGGQTSTQQNPTYTFPTAGNHQVTLTVSCGNGLCTDTKTQNVTVYAQPNANAGPDQTIPYGTSTQLSGSGGAGTFNFHWEPANMVVNPNNQNTQTVTLTQDQTYTLTVTNAQGGCVSSDEVTIHISGSAMTVTAGPNISICQGGSGQIYVNAGGGTGNISYSWMPTTGLSNPNIYNPIASPTQTTTYTCVVSDGQTTQSVSVTVTVNDVIVENDYETICPGDVLQWHGAPYSAIGTYQFDTVTDQGCDKTIYLHLDHYPIYDETTIEAAICEGESYNFFGTNYTSSIQTSHTLQTIHGCDSIIRLDLKVWPENEIAEFPVSLCPEQLPYYYEGDPYEIPLYAGLHIFYLEDIHGCDSTVWVEIDVSDYYVPPVQTEYVCYAADETPSFIWNPIGAFEFDLHETGFYTDTLPTSECDGIFSLNLNFLEKPEPVHIYDTVCNTYSWYVEGQLIGVYDEDKEAEYHISLYPYPCSKDYYLHLTVNHESVNNTITLDGDNPQTLPSGMSQLCDQYEWPFGWNGETYTFTEDTPLGGVTKTIQTQHGCDSTATLIIKNMKYTPQPEIYCPDANIEFPNYPITATEFNVNCYTYQVKDPKSIATWIADQCEWRISKDSWRIVPNPSGGNPYECSVYAMDWVPDSICLSFKAVNVCDSVIAEYWLHPSFYGIEETEAYPAVVSIIPNPNNGQMKLQFDNMEGDLSVRVYSLTGTLVDAFELKSIEIGQSHEYSMKRLMNGVYFFNVSDGKRNVTKKAVIIH